MPVTLTEKETKYIYEIEKPVDKNHNIVDFSYYHGSLNAIYTRVYARIPSEKTDHDETLNDFVKNLKSKNVN